MADACSALGLTRGGPALLVAVIAGCTGAEGLFWPSPPAGAQSMLIVSLAEDGPVVIAQEGVGPSSFSAPPGPLFLLFSSETLSGLAIEEGQLPRGNGRSLPEALATFEKVEARWAPLTSGSDDPRLATVRFAAPDRGTCLAAGGCYGLSPDPEECKLPCPCAKAPLAQDVYPHNDCPLPDPRAEVCYRSRGPLLGFGAPGIKDALGSVVDEGGKWVLYFSTDRFNPGGPPKLARAELEPSITIRPGSIEAIDLGLDPRVAQERPNVRSDALELFFQVRTGSVAKDEIWMASRPHSGAPFGRARTVLANGEARQFPVLLGDFRSLLYRSETIAADTIVRNSTIAGDLSFIRDEIGFALAPQQGAFWVNTGCNRQSVLYVRTFPQPYVLMIANLAQFNPLDVHSLLEARRDDGSVFLTGDVEDISFVETPDCRQLLFSVPGGAEVYDIVPCAN